MEFDFSDVTPIQTNGNASTIATSAIGSWSGSDTYQNFFSPVAPSIADASSTSLGIDAIPARKITVAKGRIRHACTTMIEVAARCGVPSQTGGFVLLIRCRCSPNQLMTLANGKSESKTQ